MKRIALHDPWFKVQQFISKAMEAFVGHTEGSFEHVRQTNIACKLILETSKLVHPIYLEKGKNEDDAYFIYDDLFISTSLYELSLVVIIDDDSFVSSFMVFQHKMFVERLFLWVLPS